MPSKRAASASPTEASAPGRAKVSREVRRAWYRKSRKKPDPPLQLTLPGVEPGPRVPNKLARPRDASLFQGHYFRLLLRLGFSVESEVPCPMTDTDGRTWAGRIDLVATTGDLVIAYELDNVRPKKRSIEKLKVFDCTEAWVVCRESGLIERVK